MAKREKNEKINFRTQMFLVFCFVVGFFFINDNTTHVIVFVGLICAIISSLLKLRKMPMTFKLLDLSDKDALSKLSDSLRDMIIKKINEELEMIF